MFEVFLMKGHWEFGSPKLKEESWATLQTKVRQLTVTMNSSGSDTYTTSFEMQSSEGMQIEENIYNNQGSSRFDDQDDEMIWKN